MTQLKTFFFLTWKDKCIKRNIPQKLGKEKPLQKEAV